MKNNEELIKILSKMIVETTFEIVNRAKFDRTSIGVVKNVNGNKYTVNVFGGTYEISSSKTFAVNQKVAVIAPQNNFKNLIMIEI